MTDETPIVVDELTVLKSRAKLMGIAFSNNIGIEALRARIEAKQNDEPVPVEASENPLDEASVETIPSKPETAAQLRTRLLAEQMKLIRLRITNLDPKKKDLPGEIFTVANEYIGTVRKYVPFGEVTEDGYHVPYCIYTMMKERRFLNVRATKGQNGQEIIRHNWAPEFALEILPQLTPDELRKLGSAQQAAGLFVNDQQF